MPFVSTHDVNAVLATIAPDWKFINGGNNKLYLRYGDAEMPVRLRSSDRLWLVQPRCLRHWGGTTEQAICQLVLWWRDQPRRPLAWWKYACSPQVGLGNADTIRLLSDDEPAGYGDPLKTCCILCGKADPSDWWALERVIGPCCFAGMCQKLKEG